ncbi:hypothetical protein Moror_12104 [Moniliophthora roreri MCA 2997]|uniref:Uncharacterized protein n=1 Tax=Moniliophthora roreri (strain MCA 2997) TaxID=1381753 RepID=V2XVY4_MONRO|nr:hypothetical protein Moror_12104 [Moniliophthora roreri MCA 2997]
MPGMERLSTSFLSTTRLSRSTNVRLPTPQTTWASIAKSFEKSPISDYGPPILDVANPTWVPERRYTFARDEDEAQRLVGVMGSRGWNSQGCSPVGSALHVVGILFEEDSDSHCFRGWSPNIDKSLAGPDISSANSLGAASRTFSTLRHALTCTA